MFADHTFLVLCGGQACMEYEHALVIEQLIEFTESEPAKLEKAAS